MTTLGGNQRELSRKKGHKKQIELEKSKKSSEKPGNVGLTIEQRKLRDAKALQEKARLKQEATVSATTSTNQTKKI